jgi:hypothetical protein
MGDLDQPLNTFWQLFFRPKGSGSWSDQVQATAVATNGGLVLAPGNGSLLVGIRPTNMLTFSPLISTANAGRTWSNGLITEGLASRPDALATEPSGEALAVVNTPRGTEVLDSTGNLSSWRALVTKASLSSSPSSRACGAGTVTAVGYVSATAVLGTDCSRRGAIGLLVRSGDGWQLVGLKLPAPADRAQVLGLVRTGHELAALVGLTGPGGTVLMVAWTKNAKTWSAPATLRLGGGADLASFGAGVGRGIFVLVKQAHGKDELAVDQGPGGAGWRQVTSPPPHTATVAVGPGPNIDALVTTRTVLTVWALNGSSTTWRKGQVLHVPIQFGSSS